MREQQQQDLSLALEIEGYKKASRMTGQMKERESTSRKWIQNCRQEFAELSPTSSLSINIYL